MTPIEEVGNLAAVPFKVEAELDRSIMSVEQILQLKQGSLIRLQRSAGENLDLYVSGSLLGFGEIVVVENMICIRVTDFREKL